MHPLYLTKDEQKMFKKLPDTLRDGWKVEEEKISFTDTPEARQMRLEVMRLSSPSIVEFQKKAMAAADEVAFKALVEATDFSKMSSDDVSELFFAIGPDDVSAMLDYLLSQVKADTDLENLSAFTAIRHGLLESMTSTS